MSLIHIEKVYEECGNWAGMRGTGKSNNMGYHLKKLPKGTKYTLIDTAGAFRKAKFQPSDPTCQTIIRFRKSQRLEQFQAFLEDVYQKGNTIIAIEEIDMYQTVYKMPPILDEIINVGRNYGISLWLSFRRPARVHKDLIGNAEHHFIFRIFDKASVEWYKYSTGCPYIEQAKNLRPYHFIYWRVGSEPTVCKPVDKVI